MADWWRNEFYSQFGEDGILFAYFRSKEYGRSRRLDFIPPGFYVDIGAHHPYMISNTWFFYQRGWSGICVDPTPGTLRTFTDHRPRDTTIECAISGDEGEATLFFGDSGVLNTLDAASAPEGSERVIVPTMRLATLIERHAPPGQQIDILNIDVEHLDMEVLASNDWARFRPEMIVAERHGSSLNELAQSDMVAAMNQWGYDVFAWTPPSVIFRRR